MGRVFAHDEGEQPLHPIYGFRFGQRGSYRSRDWNAVRNSATLNAIP